MKIALNILILLLMLQVGLWAQQTPLPTDNTSLFTGSGNCNTCHKPGIGHALTDSSGNDLTPAEDWRSTMMANSAKDPYWLAKVETEVTENPHLKNAIEDKCSTCHMPMGRTQAVADGADYYSIAEGLENPLALDGVSCTVCHQIQPANLGKPSSFSGGYIIDTSRVIFGPYDSLSAIGAGSMASGVLFTPTYGEHMLSSELCATCHTLYTSYVNDNGEIAGTFPEQMPYFEWKASAYPANNIRCQSCHVPQVNEDIIIAWLPSGMGTHNPIYKHQFVGGNTFMLSMLKENGSQIGVSASEAHFDSTISHTRDQLQNRTANLITKVTQKNNLLDINVTIENLTGHKFPTAYPGRRAWLHVTVTNSKNDTIFESGSYNTDGTINYSAVNYSPHYDTIDNENNVQIYEAVMGDLNGSVTQVLLRAASYLKDNRIPPLGFSSAADHYDDIAIHGLAEKDANFNAASNGSDNITYLVNINGQESGTYTVTVELLYQSVNPVDIHYFRPFETEKVNTFLSYYDKAAKIPERINFKTVEVPVVVGISNASKEIPAKFNLQQNYPNPFNPSTKIRYQLAGNSKVILKIFDSTGREIKTLVNQQQTAGKYSVKFNGKNLSSGIYFYRLEVYTQSGAGDIISQKKMLLIK